MALSCKHCGALMAPADLACAQCGQAVDKEAAANHWLEKAEELRQSGLNQEAISALRRALGLPLGAEQASAAWQKLGVLLEKKAEEGGQTGALEEAATAFQQAFSQQDTNEIAHQLWVANLARQGKLDLAVSFYKKRLEGNSQDGVAEKMLKAARLAVEFKTNPVKVSLSGGKAPKKGLLTRWLLNPNPVNMGLAALSVLVSLGLLIYSFFAPAASSGGLNPQGLVNRAIDGSGDAVGGLFSMLGGAAFDPMTNFLNLGVSGAYFFFLWKARK